MAAMTFSIAARCPETGMVGVAAATSNLCVGSRCTFVRAGVGAALTQHRTDPRLGPMMLDALARGASAAEAVRQAVVGTPHAGWRQLACVDRNGSTAWHHGDRIDPIRAACQAPDAIALGNLLRNDRVPTAMIHAFRDSHDSFPERLICALEGGLEAGGELEALRSAALLVAHEQDFPFVDLRIDLDEAPIAALRGVWQRYTGEAERFVQRAIAPEESG